MSEPKFVELNPESAAELLRRAKANELRESDCETIEALINTIAILKECFENGRLHVKRLLKMIFGVKTEKKRNVVGKGKPKKGDEVAGNPDGSEIDGPDGESPGGEDGAESSDDASEKRKKAKGHGRNGAGDLSGAEKEYVPLKDPKPGDPCPLCEKGKLYEFRHGVVVRFLGQPLVKAKVWEMEKLRCNLCGAVFKPELPKEAEGEKYDETAVAAIALAKYGFGMPFHRLQNFQACLGIPLPASTQWDKIEAGADKIYPAFEELKRRAAQGRVVHNDDTVMKILELLKENEEGRNPDSRKGMFTTGIVSVGGEATIALFFTGRAHAGENMADVLEKRDPKLPPPIQMCDALSRNFSVCDKIVLSHCNAHSRRNFVDVADNFPEQCEYVLTVFEKIYENDAACKREGMDDMRRLEFHRENSGPPLEKFHRWLDCQFQLRKAEPNSGMGKAISYALDHWEELTLFLREPGVPLDNNVCERILKKAILNRKNSLFYKTLHGAYIGDMYSSLIHTCVINGINPFDYLTSLQIHSSEVFKNPGRWLPWNYKEAMSAVGSADAPPPTELAERAIRARA
jgi:transposase